MIRESKIEEADIHFETMRNIVFIPGKAEITALPSKGLTKDNFDHCDGCHLRACTLMKQLRSLFKQFEVYSSRSPVAHAYSEVGVNDELHDG